LLRCLPSGAAAAVSVRHCLRGPSHTYANACAASATALGKALRAIRHGHLEMAVVGGCEAPFGDVTVLAWDKLRVLAPADSDPGGACRPFDHARSGLVLGEGAASLCLKVPRPPQRGVPA
jgi:3-oxoacyl-[acyl-carrier-protein] synthase II